jgi:xylulose-5-phosphate/fructose-6-phosphate phosphoketolase
MAHCLRSKNYVNLMVGSKQPQPVFLSVEEADKHCQAGASIWKFASTDDGLDPDVVLVGIGSELTFEVVTAASLLRRKCPALRVRVVNVTDLMILESATYHPHSLSEEEFSSLFTPDKPIIFNYHGYANEIRGLLFGRPNLERVTIGCYQEEGSTTTPFDMMLRNRVSRYHVMEAAIKGGARGNDKVSLDMVALVAEVKHQVVKVQEHILATGKDPEGTFDIPTFPGTVFEGGEKASAGKGSKEDGFFVN